jgi:ElaB/YqjD/DUF883 family membrane-anchored ribosome-binding protein
MEKNQAATPAPTRAQSSGASQSGRASASAQGKDKDKKAPAPLTATATQAVQSFGTLYRQVEDSVRVQVERSPYVALGAAAGIGFIVGGGLVSPLGQLLLRSSLRAFGPPLLQAVLNASDKAAEQSDSPESDS